MDDDELYQDEDTDTPAALALTNSQLENLTFSQRRFVEAYLGEARANASEAARIAGYAHPKSQGSRLLTNVDIAACVGQRVASVALTTDEVLRELTAVAMAPTSEFMQIMQHERRDRQGRVVAPMMVRQDYSAKIRALELLGKYHKLFTDKVDVSGSVATTITTIEIVRPQTSTNSRPDTETETDTTHRGRSQP